MSDFYPLDGPAPSSFYATATELRAVLGVDDTELPDAKAEDIIVTACDTVDGLLGARPFNDQGRKVTESHVDPWQWTKLKAATLKVAVRIHANPAVLTDRQYESVKGPDFETSGPVSSGLQSRLGPDVWTLIVATGLGVYSGRAR